MGPAEPLRAPIYHPRLASERAAKADRSGRPRRAGYVSTNLHRTGTAASFVRPPRSLDEWQPVWSTYSWY